MQILARFLSPFAIFASIVWFSGCAITPDNWAFQKEIIKTDSLNQVKRIALLDVPPPSHIQLSSTTSFYSWSISRLGWFFHS